MISYDDFSKLDLRTGKILEVNDHPDAQKLYVLKVDITEKVVELVAGIKPFYSPEELIGKSVVVLVNLEPKNIRGVPSQGMILVAKDKNSMGLIAPEKEIINGSKIS